MKKKKIPRSMRNRLKRKEHQKFYEAVECLNHIPWILPTRLLSMKKIFDKEKNNEMS